jgi:hypothetical protein
MAARPARAAAVHRSIAVRARARAEVHLMAQRTLWRRLASWQMRDRRSREFPQRSGRAAMSKQRMMQAELRVRPRRNYSAAIRLLPRTLWREGSPCHGQRPDSRARAGRRRRRQESRASSGAQFPHPAGQRASNRCGRRPQERSCPRSPARLSQLLMPGLRTCLKTMQTRGQTRCAWVRSLSGMERQIRFRKRWTAR